MSFQLCKHYANGVCKYGKKCNFKHSTCQKCGIYISVNREDKMIYECTEYGEQKKVHPLHPQKCSLGCGKNICKVGQQYLEKDENGSYKKEHNCQKLKLMLIPCKFCEKKIYIHLDNNGKKPTFWDKNVDGSTVKHLCLKPEDCHLGCGIKVCKIGGKYLEKDENDNYQKEHVCQKLKNKKIPCKFCDKIIYIHLENNGKIRTHYEDPTMTALHQCLKPIACKYCGVNIFPKFEKGFPMEWDPVNMKSNIHDCFKCKQ